MNENHRPIAEISDALLGQQRRPRKRATLGTATGTLLLVFLAFSYALGTAGCRQVLVNVRERLFDRVADESFALTAPPQMLESLGFAVDPQALRDEAWSALKDSTLIAAVEHSRREPTALGAAEDLVLAFSAGGVRGTCTLTGSLEEQIWQTRRGFGCCSDHTKIFLALAEIAGLSAREIGGAAHAVVEIYEPKTARWIMVDPMYALLALARDGEPLSYAALRRHFGDGTIALAPFSKQLVSTPSYSSRVLETYRADAAGTRVRLSFGNNVFQSGRFRKRSSFLRRTLVELDLRVRGVIRRPWLVAFR